MRSRLMSLVLAVFFILGSNMSVWAAEEDVLVHELGDHVEENVNLLDEYSILETENRAADTQTNINKEGNLEEQVIIERNSGSELFSEVDANGVKWEVADGVLSISGNGVIERNASLSDNENLKEGITSIIIDEGITRIGDGAFFRYVNLEKVSIPNSVKSFGSAMFYMCTGLRTVVFHGDAPEFISVDTEIGPFNSVTATVYYPLGNQTYTDGLRTSSYEGNLTWKARDSLKIILGATDDIYKRGSYEDAAITCNGELEDFLSLSIDGNKVDGSNYTSAEGSTVIGIKAKYLETLTLGKHIVTLNYIYDSIEAELTIISEETDDEIPLKIILETTKNTHVLGTDDTATIICTGELKDFVSVYVEERQVDKSNYILAEGSTILTFTAQYLNTLSIGTHPVTMNYTYGSVDTELIILSSEDTTNTADIAGGSGTTGRANVSVQSATARTGDNTVILPWLLMVLITVAVSAGTVFVRRKYFK